MKRFVMAVLAATCATAATAASKPADVIQFKPNKPIVTTPEKAYIFFRGNTVAKMKSDIIFVRDLTPAEIEEYQAAQRKAEDKRNARALADLNTRRAGSGQKPLAVLPPQPAGKPLPPVVPYIKNGVANVVRAMGGRALVKGAVEKTYLLQVPAGTYLLAGQSLDNMVGGTCMCMGSVRFEAKAGQITDLGHILSAPENAPVDIPEFKGLGFDPTIKIAPWNVAVRPVNADTVKPVGLGSLPIVPAVYVAADKFPNFFGMLVNRMPTIPGLLVYDGDKVVPPPTSTQPTSAPAN